MTKSLVWLTCVTAYRNASREDGDFYHDWKECLPKLQKYNKDERERKKKENVKMFDNKVGHSTDVW